MKPLRIHFVTKASPKLASFRMRIQTPSHLLNYAFDGQVITSYGPAVDNKADVNVFSKHFDQEQTLSAIRSKEDFGFKAVFDVCDDHFDRVDGPFYEKMIEAADYVTCNSANMQERIYEVTGTLARIIPDPITFPDGKFKPVLKGEDAKVLWFGHNSNLGSLVAVAERNESKIVAYSNVVHKDLKNIQMFKWGLGVVENQIKCYDVVVLPTQRHQWAKCKSPNRAVDAIISGKFVITDSEEIYADLKPYLMIVQDLTERKGALDEALAWWKNNLPQVKQMVEAGQTYVKEKNSPENIVDGWVKVLSDVGLIGGSKMKSA